MGKKRNPEKARAFVSKHGDSVVLRMSFTAAAALHAQLAASDAHSGHPDADAPLVDVFMELDTVRDDLGTAFSIWPTKFRKWFTDAERKLRGNGVLRFVRPDSVRT